MPRVRAFGLPDARPALAALLAHLAREDVSVNEVRKVDGGHGPTDESAIAYKDVDEVMAASVDLVAPTLRLLPVGVCKG